MKALLNNRFAPVTYSWGFLEKPLPDLVDFQIKWVESLHQPNKCKLLEADLSRALQSLEPLDSGNVLYVTTKSIWTAVFQGCVGVTSPFSQISYPAEALQCRGVIVTCVEDTFDDRTGEGQYGGVSFEMFAAHPIPDGSGDPLVYVANTERVVSAIHDTGGWDFHTFGTPKEFEKTETYTRRRIRDRLTAELLEEYCAALGIRLFDADFYGPHCALIYSTIRSPDRTTETYEDVQKKLGLRC